MPQRATQPSIPGPRAEVRAVACWILDRALETRRPTPVLLEPYATAFDRRDLALLRELVLGSLRWLLRLDHVVENASGRQSVTVVAPGRIQVDD